MDARYAFPVGKAPIPRSRPVNTTQTRESNALRASVLDAAVELGITNNSVVAAWMFDNTLKEEDEEEEEAVSSPGLTNRSSAPSEESTSYQYPSTPPDIAVGARKNSGKDTYKPTVTWTPSTYNGYQGASESQASIAFPSGSSGDAQISTRPTTPNGLRKLRKKNKDSGYDSDGGYLSEGGKKMSKKEAKAKLKEEKRELKEEKREQKDEERKRKKSLTSVLKVGRKAAPEASGYETDGAGASSSKSPFKSKSKKKKDSEAGYDTDGGYVSSGSNMKKKKGFFGLGSKNSRSDLREEIPDVPVPPLPKETNGFLPPIAGRFATSLGALSPELPSITPSQPLSFDPLPTSSSSPTSTTPQALLPDRMSLASGESSSSNQQGPALFPTTSRDNSSTQAHHHGTGAGSISTINSSINSSIISSALGSNGHSLERKISPQTPQNPPQATAVPQRPPRSPISPTTGALKSPLPISFPLTRATSPVPSVTPIVPLHIVKNSEAYSRGASPLPGYVPSASPYPGQSSSLSDSTSSNPTRNNYSDALSPDTLSQLPSRSETPVRPRNPPIDGFGPRNARSPSPNPTNNNLLSPTRLHPRALSPLVVPQNSSGDLSPLPSPSTHRYSDIPPPNPPPMGPLPSVPTGALSPGLNNSGPPPPSSHLRHQAIERPRGREMSVSMQPIQRGREAPFPSRPIAPIPGATDASDAYGGIADALPQAPRFRNGAPPVANAAAFGRFAGGTPSPPGSSSGTLPQRPRMTSTTFDSPKLSPVGDAPRPMQVQQSRGVHWEAGLISPGGPSGVATLPPAHRPKNRTPGPMAQMDDGADYEYWSEDEDDDLKDVLNGRRGGSAEGSEESVYDSVSHEDHIQPRSILHNRNPNLDQSHPYSGPDYAITTDSSPDVRLASAAAAPERRLVHQRSFETRRPDPKHDSFAISEYYGWDDASTARGNRESRWSGSIYSRVSILDPEQSEETRDRFVRRVEAMLAKEREDAPPVPKIPAGFALANAASLNRF